EPDEQEEQQHRRGGREVLGDDLRDEVADHRGEDDHHPAHGRRTALGVVAGRAVLADLLAVALAGEQLDRVAGPDEGDDQRQPTAEQDRSHSLSLSTRPWATCSSAAPREALTRTTSPAAMFSRNHARAASRSATGTAVPPQSVTDLAPATIGAAAPPP